MLHTRTVRFQQYVAGLHDRQAALSAEIEALSALRRGTRSPAQVKRLQSLRGQLQTVSRQLSSASDIRSFTWIDAFHMLAELDGTLWSDAERIIFQQELTTFEGPGEKPLRYRFGLPLEPTMDSHDLFDDEEVKYLTERLEPFRIGQIGRAAYLRVFKEIVRQLPDEAMSAEMWDNLANGEVSAGKLYNSMPDVVKMKLQAALAPSQILQCYSAIYLTTPDGFVRVPRCDFSAAFSLVAVTQMSPKYRLRRDYVETRLGAEQVPDGATVDQPGQMADEGGAVTSLEPGTHLRAADVDRVSTGDPTHADLLGRDQHGSVPRDVPVVLIDVSIVRINGENVRGSAFIGAPQNGVHLAHG